MRLLKDFLNLFLERYRKGLEDSITASEFIFDSVDSLYYDLKKVSVNRGRPYIDSPE